MISDPEIAQDVLQESFIKVWKKAKTYDSSKAKLFTWLYRIAVNSAKNYLVSQSRKPPASDVDAQEAEFYEGADALHENSSPERSLLTKEIEKYLYQAIDKLPDELRMAITLREMEGMSYEDIASVMECPVGTVRSRIFRAREAIDAVIGELISAHETTDAQFLLVSEYGITEVNKTIHINKFDAEKIEIDFNKTYVMVCQRGLNSYRATERLKKKYPNLKVLNLTGGISSY